ncbi:MAG: serine hydrolase domain-containing protein, partial [Eubacteriales bacterium]
MNLNAINKLATLVFRFLDSKKSTVPVVKTVPQKPEMKTEPIKKAFRRVSPETVGLPSSLIEDYIRRIKLDKTLNMHNIMILRGGNVIYECSFGGQDINIPKMTFSACKSITSLAIGMLCDEGKLSLDEHAVDIFGENLNFIDKKRMEDITIRDILTMRSGIVFNEAESFVSSNWIKSYFSSAISGKIGEDFNYNSLNTYILSAIVLKKSGKHLMDYLDEKLFAPLSIKDVVWEKCPSGIEKGGWGLYIRPEDMAKIGYLVLNGGVWHGKRIISEEYLKEATSKKVETPESDGAFNYGYQIWVGRNSNTFLFNGMLGQNVLAFRDNGIIIVSNAGNGELFQQGNFYSLTLETFDRKFEASLPPDKAAELSLKRLTRTLVFGEGRRTFPCKNRIFEELDLLFSRQYEADDANAPSMGLLPAVLQVSQNNYTSGVKGLSFALDRKNSLINVRFEENDETHEFRAGLIKGERTEIDFHG